MLSISCLTTSSGQQRSDLGTGSPHHPLQAPWAHQIRGHEEELHLLTVQKANMAAGHFAFSAEGKKEKKIKSLPYFRAAQHGTESRASRGGFPAGIRALCLRPPSPGTPQHRANPLGCDVPCLQRTLSPSPGVLTDLVSAGRCTQPQEQAQTSAKSRDSVSWGILLVK